VVLKLEMVAPEFLYQRITATRYMDRISICRSTYFLGRLHERLSGCLSYHAIRTFWKPIRTMEHTKIVDYSRVANPRNT